MARIWAGVDAGKTHHHCVAIDENGKRLLSRRMANDEPVLLDLVADVLALGADVVWAVDLADGAADLLIALLVNHDQHLLHIPGRVVNRAADGYRGEGKTDWEDRPDGGVLRLVGPEDRSASCLVGDASAGRGTPLRGAGRVRCGLIGA